MTQSDPDPSLTSPVGVGPEDHRPHRPADDREEVYYQGSPLLRGNLGKLFLFVLIGAVLIVLPIFLHFGTQTHLPGLAWAAFIAVGLLLIVLPVLLQRTVRYRVSNYRIDYERGVFGKSIDTLELWHVEDIKFNQSFFDRLLGVGTITVISHDETTPKLDLHGVPNPRPLFEQLKQRVIAVKRQRGVVKMDVG